MPAFNNKRAETFRIVLVDNIYGGGGTDYLEIIVRTLNMCANESEAKKEPVMDRTEEICLKMSWRKAKSIYQWLGKHIQQYEKAFGEIQTYEEMQKKLEEAGLDKKAIGTIE